MSSGGQRSADCVDGARLDALTMLLVLQREKRVAEPIVHAIERVEPRARVNALTQLLALLKFKLHRVQLLARLLSSRTTSSSSVTMSTEASFPELESGFGRRVG